MRGFNPGWCSEPTKDNVNKSVNASDAIQDLTIKLGDLAQAKFDNVKSEYEELIAYFTSYADIIDERINRSQEHGFFVSKDYYRQLLDYEQRELNQLNNEYADLIKTRDEAVASGAITEGSSAWNQMCQEINAVEKAIEESTTAMVEYNNAIRDIDWEIFDFTEDRIRRIIDETEFLTGLLSNDKLYEDDGRLTAIGEATNGMYAIQYETLMQQAKDYAEERKRLEAEMASDPAKQASKDYVQRLDEIIDAQQEAIESAEQMKDAVKDLVNEAISTHLSFLDELISKYEEMLDKEKAAYDYNKNIEKQVKNISNLQRMLDAYSGDDSEEARKTRQQTANQLEEAQQQLEETEWDKMISETKDLLTEMRDEYEEVLMARLDDVDLLMRDMIEHADANAQTIKETIETETSNVGYALTEPLQNIFNKIDSMNLAEDLNEKFKDSFKNALSAVETTISDIKTSVTTMVGLSQTLVDAEAKRQSEAAAEAKAERLRQEQAQREAENARNAEAQRQAQEEANRRAQEEANRKAQEEANRKVQEEAAAKASPQGDGSPNVGDKVTFVSGRYTQDSYGQGRSGQKYQGQQVYITKINLKGSKPYHISTGSTLGDGDLGWVTLDQLSGYAKGSRGISKNQYAWTQENGAEIIRTSDGALLTPLNRGDQVFTADMSRKLFDFAKSDIPNSLLQNQDLIKNSTTGTINNQNDITINLPNVTNYEQFKAEMKKDGKLQSWMQEITFGQAIGKNSLRKNNY